MQEFDVTVSAKLGGQSKLALRGPGGSSQAATNGSSFTPLAMGNSASFDLPIAFVGYGISAPDLDYDDYEGVDVKDHAVIVLRHEPQRNNPHSAFDGTENSSHAPLRSKVSNAFQHGAAAVIFVTDAIEISNRSSAAAKRVDTARDRLAQVNVDDDPDKHARLVQQLERAEQKSQGDHDELLPFDRAGGSGEHHDLPVFHCSRTTVDKWLSAAGLPALETLETTINQQPAPSSVVLRECRLIGAADLSRETVSATNVVGLLPGTGERAKETIVVGAHYDHLGRGEPGSAEPESRDIHNGADDNASGAVALVRVAQQLISRNQALGRQIAFVAFTGEERGLLGSAHFVKNPPAPLENIVAMINFDMVGRLRDNKLIIQGTGTAEQFDGWLDEANQEFGFELVRKPGGYGPSDHTNFYSRKIPVMHLFTGSHDDYHKPSDDFELLNLPGIERVSQFTAQLVSRMADAPSVDYVLVDEPETPPERRDPRPYFGSIPDFGVQGKGYAISGVAPGSPADEGGLEGGDAIVQLGPHRIGGLEDFDLALRKFAAGDAVAVVVVRADKRVELEVILAPPR